jgi:hypothetical protein
MEGWYEPEEARNATYKRFSRLQVSAATHRKLCSSSSWHSLHFTFSKLTIFFRIVPEFSFL